jgi:sulfate adenylyltransferase large subunit
MDERALIEQDVEAYLDRYQNKDLLRFVAVGSVDDGKSTLIGRLLHDTHGVYEDQLAAVRAASKGRGAGEIDFSLITDGLRAEREQGITIDVAYRYFSTTARKFIIADTPGHVQYTRNMVTGASTADVALILVDARLGVLQQSRRHGYIASLLGIPHLAVCINKMDLVGYDATVFETIRDAFLAFATSLGPMETAFFPISALRGDNVVTRSEHTDWYEGPTVLQYLETVPLRSRSAGDRLRFPVQTVIRPHLDYRGFAGQVASGHVLTGDEILVLPSGRRSRVAGIDTFEGERGRADAPQSVTLRLRDEVDVSRGDLLCHAADLPRVGRTFDAHLVWMNERALDVDKTYLVKHTTQYVRAQVAAIHWRKDMDTLAEVPSDGLTLNDIGRVTMTCHRALYYDGYRENRHTGAFILIDSLTNESVAAGMIVTDGQAQDLDAALRELRAGSALAPKTQVSPRERTARMGQTGVTLWLAGLPGSGRWALAYALERRLFDLGHAATVIDPSGEDLRSMISAARACTDAGLVTICAFPSYKRADREAVRARVGAARVFVVYVNTSLETCRERRPDAVFEGFEPPRRQALTVSLDDMRTAEAAELIVRELERWAGLQDHGP